MQITPQTQDFIRKTVDSNNNGVTYQELSTLDQNQDNRVDTDVRQAIDPEDIEIIESALKQLRSGQHEPTEIVFPALSQEAEEMSPLQMGSLALPSVPWPPPTKMKLPSAAIQENFGLGIDTPEKAIYLALGQVSQVMSVPLGDIRYNKDLNAAAKFNEKTGEIEIGNDAFRTLGSLKATLVHELVHRRHFLYGKLFNQPLGKSEIEAYNFVLSQRDRLGLSAKEVQLQETLRDKVQSEWKQGVVPAYARPVKKPPNHAEILKRWGL